MRTVPGVLRIQHVPGALLDGKVTAGLAAGGPRRPGRVLALDRLGGVAGAGSPRGVRVVPGRVTVDEATFQLAELSRAALATVGGMNENGSALGAEALAAGGIARTTLPVGRFAVLLEVGRVVGAALLVADWDVGEFAIFTARIQTIFSGHKVVIISAASGEEQYRAVVLFAVKVPARL